MDEDRRKTLAAITIIVGFLILVAIVVGVLVSGKKTISPVPDDSNAIKIIFITPTPTQGPTPTVALTPTAKTTLKPTPTKKPVATPTAEETLTPTPTKAASSSATPTP